MSDDSKSFEKKLDRDFLYYLNLSKDVFGKVKSDQSSLCEAWLTHLFGKKLCSISEKCNRNVFLSRLLIQMQCGELKGTFLEAPTSDTLPCAFTTFGLPTVVEGVKGFEEMGFQVDSSIGGGSGDFFESSRDGRTYLATRHLPQGLMAYMAVTNNEGEEVWVPQSQTSNQGVKEKKALEKKAPGYTKKLLDCIKVPICEVRKSPEQREQVLEWMDKIISDCNKWISGEDPHNMELEELFEELYKEYKEDPENSELLQHPKTVRTILFKDIRDLVSERREEVSKREMILDQYETEEYLEDLNSNEYLDDVWLECAKKPMNDSVKAALMSTYPPEVVDRFNELLFQERLMIIQAGEKKVKKKISELRKSSIEDTKKELQRLKKAHDDYKEFYCIFKDVEEKMIEFEKEYKEKCLKPNKSDPQSIEKYKQDTEVDIQRAKRDFDREIKIQHDLREKLEEAKAAFRKVKEQINAKNEKLNCQINQLNAQKEDLSKQICALKKKNYELQAKFGEKNKNSCRP